MRALVTIFVGLLAPTAFAHHSPAAYDVTRTVRIEGVVERYEWANPHVYIHLSTGDGRWLVEGGSPSMLQRGGWSRSTLTAGDVITAELNPLRNGERRMGLLLTVQKSGGPVLSARGQAPPAAVRSAAASAVDLGGNWLPSPDPVFLQFVLAPTAWSLTPRALQAMRNVNAESNPGKNCVALQSPWHMAWTDLKNIELMRDAVVIRSAVNVDVERIVHLDQTTHDGAPTTNEGHSIGRWEDSVLVVDTRNFAEHELGNREGVPSSPQKHLVERFELSPDGTTLTYRFRLEDPVYLERPFEGSAVWAYRPDLTYTAEPCNIENARRYLDEQ